MKLVIVSGLSGSGKTVALHTLEDEGFYCVDNLLLGLLPDFVREILNSETDLQDRSAIGIDARSGAHDMRRFPGIIEEIRSSGMDLEVIFFQAEVDTLLKRFSETRRKHPLTRNSVPLFEAINLEINLLADIAEHADLKIDTTHTNVHQLRDLVRSRIRSSDDTSLSLLFQSFGFKHGVPTDSDYVFDARCLPNPYWEPELRTFTGQEPAIIDYLESHESVAEMFEGLSNFLEKWIPQFEKETRRYLTISIGCTGGQHRSVYLAEKLTAHFREKHDDVSTRHRELL